MTTTISINELSKFFGDTKAVNGVSLDVKRGEVFGFLGPNAAGKSTTVKVAATLLCPTKGTILVDGYDVQTDPVEVRSAIGLLPEDGATTHYDRLSAYQNLEYFGRLYDVPEEMLHDRIIQLLEFLELADRAEDSPATYSTGLKQKLSLARSLIHDPSVVFLDEPTSSLDPIMSRRIRQFIDQQAEAGKQTFFLCTHLLSEFEHLCDRVGFISKGVLEEVGNPKELRQKFWKVQTFALRLLNADLASVQATIQSTGLTLDTRIEGNLVVFELEEAEKGNPKILKALIESKVDIIEVRERVPDLEAVYRKVIGGV
ncbi:MAG: ABC transporter ATP-binding protein [Candidatus Hermodarchaeota archaeon]|nr:ABC transporter ATP-binding protein [Candidatus Hermodarchaeota archaeon]